MWDVVKNKPVISTCFSVDVNERITIIFGNQLGKMSIVMPVKKIIRRTSETVENLNRTYLSEPTENLKEMRLFYLHGNSTIFILL